VTGDYKAFLELRSQLDQGSGFRPTYMPDYLFGFQKFLVDWAVRTGRSATFADCGMGKTLIQLTWAQNVVEHTNKPVLVLAPLSVSSQTVEEAGRFGIDAIRSPAGTVPAGARIVVTNYERLHHFDATKFAGVVCDESSIIKNFDGVRKESITGFMRKTPYRLLCTATAAPNDYIELGTSSEALGYLGYMDMLSTFFKNDEDSIHPAFIGSKWRFKRHAESRFWRWMASWARACRKPSDLGFSDDGFVLPELLVEEHEVESPIPPGMMLPPPARSLDEQRADTRVTMQDRCELAAEKLAHDRPGIAWCNLNAEGDLLRQLIPGSVQVSGSDSDDAKEEVFRAFRSGQVRVIVTKPKIAAFGMNWQHCAHMTYFPTHSFEQYYQAVRRSWRFGQKSAVRVDVITSYSQSGVLANLKRKQAACEDMFALLVSYMNNATSIKRTVDYTTLPEVPKWLS
jgi:hypothetical protein